MKYATTVAALALCLSLVGCASSGSSTASDAGITSKVKARLSADPEINPFRIDVDTRHGVVTLSGTVKRENQRDEALRLAGSTTGVVRVIDDISVGHKSFGESVDDAWIVTKVTSKLAADPEINPFTIDVDCNQGVVTLRGEVKRPAQRIEAERLALNTKGVRKVRNKIRLRGE